MKIDGGLLHAMLGIQRGVARANKNAHDIANATSPESPGDLARPMIGLIENTQQVKASAAVVRAVDNMIGSLFDDEA